MKWIIYLVFILCLLGALAYIDSIEVECASLRAQLADRDQIIVELYTNLPDAHETAFGH